jgi:hypothetical protein
MTQGDPSVWPVLLLSGVVSGVLVAILNFLFTRSKTKAETEKLRLEAQKLRDEMRTSTENLAASVTYQLSNKAERLIYSSVNSDTGFDFKGSEGYIWGPKDKDGKSVPITAKGLGELKFDKGILNIQRTNTDGRYELYLQTYLCDGTTQPFLPKDELRGDVRRMKVTFDAKVVGGEHTLKIVFRNPKTYDWLANGQKRIVENSWVSHTMYLQVSPSQDCQLRIDDQEVSQAPSSVQIRNFTLTEKIA